MGYYIQTPKNKNKATQIANMYEGNIIPRPSSFQAVLEGKALICVVDNGLFEAAAFCYSQEEYEAFSVQDGRPRVWLLMDWNTAKRVTGFEGA